MTILPLNHTEVCSSPNDNIDRSFSETRLSGKSFTHIKTIHSVLFCNPHQMPVWFDEIFTEVLDKMVFRNITYPRQGLCKIQFVFCG